jgi:hypothetical protein
MTMKRKLKPNPNKLGNPFNYDPDQLAWLDLAVAELHAAKQSEAPPATKRPEPKRRIGGKK